MSYRVCMESRTVSDFELHALSGVADPLTAPRGPGRRGWGPPRAVGPPLGPLPWPSEQGPHSRLWLLAIEGKESERGVQREAGRRGGCRRGRAPRGLPEPLGASPGIGSSRRFPSSAGEQAGRSPRRRGPRPREPRCPRANPRCAWRTSGQPGREARPQRPPGPGPARRAPGGTALGLREDAPSALTPAKSQGPVSKAGGPTARAGRPGAPTAEHGAWARPPCPPPSPLPALCLARRLLTARSPQHLRKGRPSCPGEDVPVPGPQRPEIPPRGLRRPGSPLPRTQASARAHRRLLWRGRFPARLRAAGPSRRPPLPAGPSVRSPTPSPGRGSTGPLPPPPLPPPLSRRYRADPGPPEGSREEQPVGSWSPGGAGRGLRGWERSGGSREARRVDRGQGVCRP